MVNYWHHYMSTTSTLLGRSQGVYSSKPAVCCWLHFAIIITMLVPPFLNWSILDWVIIYHILILPSIHRAVVPHQSFRLSRSRPSPSPNPSTNPSQERQSNWSLDLESTSSPTASKRQGERQRRELNWHASWWTASGTRKPLPSLPSHPGANSNTSSWIQRSSRPLKVCHIENYTTLELL